MPQEVLYNSERGFSNLKKKSHLFDFGVLGTLKPLLFVVDCKMPPWFPFSEGLAKLSTDGTAVGRQVLAVSPFVVASAVESSGWISSPLPDDLHPITNHCKSKMFGLSWPNLRQLLRVILVSELTMVDHGCSWVYPVPQLLPLSKPCFLPLVP